MITAHDRMRAVRYLPTAPFELLLDPDTEHVIVTWPDLPAGLSLVYARIGDELYGFDDMCPHHAWVEEKLGAERCAEIEGAVEAVFDDHHERAARVAEIYRALEGSDAH
jgi:hypothetical protein